VDAPGIKIIPAAGTWRRFLANSVIVNQGYPAGDLFLLLTGRVRLFLLTEAMEFARERSLSTLPAG
jgi:CRP-like cAMP-binding protein